MSEAQVSPKPINSKTAKINTLKSSGSLTKVLKVPPKVQESPV